MDRAVRALLKTWNVPGAAVAVARDGKLILARGYGYADFEARQPVQPTSRFRIGSTSKVLTAMAVLHLREQGLLDLERPFLQYLPQFQLPPGADARLPAVTLRQLLHHSGGWDRDLRGDPLDLQREISSALGVPTPVMCSDVFRYQLGKHLDFEPGTRFDYSNFGYCILGLVVEAVSGRPLELYVRDSVLAPMGVNAMSIGYSHLAERGTEEVRYYDWDGAPLADSLFPGEDQVPLVYGAFDPMTFAAAGGWIGSAVDLTRIFSAIDGSRTAPFLSDGSRGEWLEDPHLPGISGAWYGLGIFVRTRPDRWWHGGSLFGGQTLLVHDEAGNDFAIVTNSRTGDPDGFSADETNAVFAGLVSLTGAAEDLYPQFPSPPVPPRSR